MRSAMICASASRRTKWSALSARTIESFLDHAPDVPYCRGMLRHEERLALVVDLEKLIEVFPVPVI